MEAGVITFINVCAFIFLTGQPVTGLKDVRVTVPIAVTRGDNARLRCHFDLEGDQLYSVKWYFGPREFYRYTPREKPAIKMFPVMMNKGYPSLDIDTFSSNETQVMLKNVSTPFSGRYSCEVSADAPSFHTALVSGEMTVVVVPQSRPVLMGVKPRYRIGDTLRANCTSPGSRPAANLTWVLNDQSVDTRFVRQYRGMQPQADLETSSTTLELPLMNQHFTKKGRLKVRCAASIHNIYWQTTEKSAEEERPRGLVNDVVQHVQYRPDDLESVYDDRDVAGDDVDPTSSSSEWPPCLASPDVRSSPINAHPNRPSNPNCSGRTQTLTSKIL
ncbi:cell adhesion molecule 2 [Nilaparvata lugens]|uniref:cell adhesion molecule 2 n=1 Tax=Nilaparvata lugens TaxID=108931 RepID=UPI00193D3053|nr:cell adhesion molecule 2 [Nilaparvata lugens]